MKIKNQVLSVFLITAIGATSASAGIKNRKNFLANAAKDSARRARALELDQIIDATDPDTIRQRLGSTTTVNNIENPEQAAASQAAGTPVTNDGSTPNAGYFSRFGNSVKGSVIGRHPGRAATVALLTTAAAILAGHLVYKRYKENKNQADLDEFAADQFDDEDEMEIEENEAAELIEEAVQN